MADPLEYMISEYRARKFWECREYEDALEEAIKAAGQANKSGDHQAYWRMSLLMAECQQELGLINDFAQSAKRLAEDSSMNGDPAMKARAMAIHAQALHYLGQIEDSLTVAQEAAAIDFPDNELNHGRFETHQALVASLAESGQLEKSWEVAQSMLALITPQVDGKTAGEAYWAVGNVAFLMDKNDEGCHYHDLAAARLSPGNDVNLWALFNKASAIVRLYANITDISTLECIERAELAISVSGASPEDQLEVSLARAHWLLLTGGAEESVRSLEQILSDREQLPKHLLADVEYVHALALSGTGRLAEALLPARSSEDTFLKLGAIRKAGKAREIIDIIEASNR